MVKRMNLKDYVAGTLLEAEQRVPLGRYDHYKGNQYEVVGHGIHTETLEVMVSYRRVGTEDSPGPVWLRPLNVWVSPPAEQPHRIRFVKVDE